MFFTLLFPTIALTVCIVSRTLYTDQLCFRSASNYHAGQEKNCLSFDPLPVSIHLFSSKLTRPLCNLFICFRYANRPLGSIASTGKTHGFLLILLLLSRVVQLNPGPVYLGIQQDSGVEPHLATTMVASRNEVSA